MLFRNYSLKKFNTFGLDYSADRFFTIASETEAIAVFKERELFNDPSLILGSGSNLLFMENFNGSVFHSEITGIKIEEKHPDYVIVSAGSGINWDDFVIWAVENGYGGLENLSLIPGLVGAAPVQNIGAYGVEAKDTIEKVRAVSVSDGNIIEFSKRDCRFDYRNSIFKKDSRNKYFITRVFFRLTSNPLLKLDYGSLENKLLKTGKPTLKNVRQAVVNIRRAKLPDPGIIGNAGSFFKNPVISTLTAENIKTIYREVPLYDYKTGLNKIAAGWLIDKCGWKGKKSGNAGVHENQALVLVNYGNATGKEIYDLSESIKKSVMDKFGITLEREVEVVGSI